ncbi:ubiquitin ligase subunit [Trichoderma cornu-damae]|uniref:Ubiquitin ligase subunit n=1 Tax=Trichoderma cornu-damae TaxID=654480 RepID=A0A9P8QZF4_9HYPO|nr:ubiquitin ligase subunit [Trichoderma cornu-damae]
MALSSEPQKSSIGSRVASIVQSNPQKTAILDNELTISYKELHIRAQELCHRLVKAGIGREDIVAIITSHGSEHIIAQLGIAYAGGTCLPLDPSISDSVLQTRITFANPRHYE